MTISDKTVQQLKSTCDANAHYIYDPLCEIQAKFSIK